jgi:hypothetical protein
MGGIERGDGGRNKKLVSQLNLNDSRNLTRVHKSFSRKSWELPSQIYKLIEMMSPRDTSGPIKRNMAEFRPTGHIFPFITPLG